MDPSLLNFAGPSNYHLAQQHQQHPHHAQQHHLQHPSHHMQQHPAAYGIPGSGLVQPTFASSPSTPSSRAPGTNASPYPDAGSIEPADMPADSRAAPVVTGPLVEPHQELNDFLENFWMRQMDNVEREEQDGKVNVSLPLARIKKVMKSDEEVKMISAEVPIMFSKACEELTCRAWLIAESHKRRTLQKSDVAAAIAHSDMFDFLIDIVPRDGENGDAAEGGDSKAQSVGDDDGQDDGEDEGEEMYREYVEGDE